MELNRDTKLIEILKEYPWMEDEAARIDEKLAVIKTPFGKMLARKTSLADLCRMGNVEYDDVINTLNKMIEEHQERKTVMEKYVCMACGYVYDPEVGDPDSGIAPGTAFEDLPEDWTCPVCGVGKDMFEKKED